DSREPPGHPAAPWGLDMPIRVSNLRLPLGEPEAHLRARLAVALGVRPEAVAGWRILRKSLDARDKDALQFVYTAEVALPAAGAPAARAGRRRPRDVHVEFYEDPPFRMPPPGARPLDHRPVVIGSGPGGLVAAYFLAEQGYRPLVLERGRAVRDRIRD